MLPQVAGGPAGFGDHCVQLHPLGVEATPQVAGQVVARVDAEGVEEHVAPVVGAGDLDASAVHRLPESVDQPGRGVDLGDDVDVVAVLAE